MTRWGAVAKVRDYTLLSFRRGGLDETYFSILRRFSLFLKNSVAVMMWGCLKRVFGVELGSVLNNPTPLSKFGNCA